MPVLNHYSIQSFLDYLKYEKRYSVHTLTSYKTDLIDFIDFLGLQFGELELKDVNHTYIRSWMASKKENGLSIS